MRTAFSSILLVSILMLSPLTAKAGEVVACGVPASAEMETEVTADYCDIHQRRLAYRSEAMKHHEQIQERRENYVAPQNAAKRQYEADMESLDGSRSAQGTE